MKTLNFFFLFFLTIVSSKESYERSLFGHPGTDEVHNDFVDGVEILQTGLPHPTLNHIKNGHYSSSIIEDDDYPWPGHNYKGSCTNALIIEEADNIISKYRRTDLKQEEVHWHPAGAATWYTTQEELNKADRVKLKYTFIPEHEHVLPAFLPPGELITVEIPEDVAANNKLGFTFNVQTRESGSILNNRLPKLIIRDIRLRNKVNTIATPYGATMQFHYSGPNPVEIIVSGVIPQPYFIYGQHSDEEWENTLSKLPGPYAFIDSGNLVHIVPAKFVRNSYRLNDCMHFWRSAVQISQTTAKDCSSYNNPRFGRFIHPCLLKYDTFVPAGAAVAYPGGNFVHFPCDWITSSVNYNSGVDNPWGTVHEINHHHQENWAKTQESGEMSNNAVSLVIYAKQNLASSTRPTSGWGRYSYASYMMNNQDSYGLQRYSTLLHFFGVDKFKEFVKADQENAWYPRNKFGNSGSEMLRASRVFKRNMRYHWNFHLTSDEALNSSTDDTFAELEKLNLKPFHPVTTVYAVGNIVDGVAFTTARPYRLETYEQTIDFVSTKVQRPNTEQFGDFEFVSCAFEPGRQNAWKEVSKGVYKVTPKDNMLEDEEVNVSYRDKTTNEIHVVICQFTTFYSSNSISHIIRYGGIPDDRNNLFDAYRYVVQNQTEDTKSFIIDQNYLKQNGIANPKYSNSNVNTWISILEGKLTPPETGTYLFSATGQTQVAFYLSEEPLKNDPDLDADKLTNFQPTTTFNYNIGNKSKPIDLVKDKVYYFRHIVFPSKDGNREGVGWLGYKLNGSTGNFVNVPQSWFKFSDKELTAEQRFNHQFVPKFERMYLMDKWKGQTYLKNDQSKWKVYKVPKGNCVINSNNYQGQTVTNRTATDVLTDSDPTTEYRVSWWPANVALKFPHVFEIDMGQTERFSSLHLGHTGNMNFFPNCNFVNIYLAPYNYTVLPQNENETKIPYSPSNYSIHHNESLIWSGVIDSRNTEYLEFDKTFQGRFMKLEFINNSITWKDGNPGRTDLSSIEIGSVIHAQKVYPMTNTKYIQRSLYWEEYRGGIYYNGKGYTGYAKGQKGNRKNSVLQIRIPKGKKEFGIIGDYYPSMGKATVKLDGKVVGTIGERSLDIVNDQAKLKRASRAYETLLFFTNEIDPNTNHLFLIEITQGSLTFAGFLIDQMVVDYFTDDGTYEKIISQEQLPNFAFIDPGTDEPVPPEVLPTPEGESNVDTSGKKKKGLSGGAIAGIIIALLAAIGIAVGVFIMYKKEMFCFESALDKSMNSALFSTLQV